MPPRPHTHSPTRSAPWALLLAATLLTGLLSGCAFYSFTGANIPSRLETIAIPLAQDNTASPVSSLGRRLTTLLTEQFADRTSLSLTTNQNNADALLTARITDYQNQPTGVSGDERATTNTVTLRVQVQYVDQVRDSTLIDQTFTGAADYDPIEAGLQGEQEAARLALERIADDAFTEATSDW